MKLSTTEPVVIEKSRYLQKAKLRPASPENMALLSELNEIVLDDKGSIAGQDQLTMIVPPSSLENSKNQVPPLK